LGIPTALDGDRPRTLHAQTRNNLNSVMDGCTKFLNYQKNSENTENQSLLKSKRIRKAKYRISGICIFIFSMPEGRFIHLPPYPVSYAILSEVFPLPYISVSSAFSTSTRSP